MDERRQPRWEGPELAMSAVTARLEAIKLSLQPPRPDLIFQAAEESLFFMAQLQQWYLSQPLGSAYYQSVHKQIPPAGGYPPQVEEQVHLEREFERRERWTEQR